MTQRVQFEDLAKLPPRPAESHKGLFGRVLVVGGCRQMSGALSLAANAALRGGAGLVTFAAPRDIQLTVAALCPCATSVALDCDDSGTLAPSAVRQVLDAAKRSDVLAVGPGMGVGPDRQAVIRAVLGQTKPVVLDADGLTNLSQIHDWPALRKCSMILTPHPGEFSRLTARTVLEIQADREDLAVSAVHEWTDPYTQDVPPLACLLKGHHTIVTDGRRVYVNQTGNPGMATGGSGDVLTGLAAALLGQHLPVFDAACLAAWAHGRAGDLAVEMLCQTSLIATDLLVYLPQAFRGMS